MPAIQFSITKVGGKYYASDGTDKFYIGTSVGYKGTYGLMNETPVKGLMFNPAATNDNWYWFIYPTVLCESGGNYVCLNTYDRARFTFEYMQFAAHVPNGDFVNYFRKLLALPEAKDYFPFLQMQGGHIWNFEKPAGVQLENNGENGTKALMDYLNKDEDAIDDNELVCSAKFVHWAMHSKAHRDLQDSESVALFKSDMKNYGIRFNLNGWPDYICQVICDIFHQGRAKYSVVHDILSSAGSQQAAYDQLMQIGSKNRISTLQSTHKRLLKEGIFGKKWDQAQQMFV